MSEKEYIDPASLQRDAFLLAARIYASGFRPDVVLVVWRGGTPIGLVVHEFLQYKGIRTYHAALKAESYSGIEQNHEPRIEHLESVLEYVPAGSRVLLVDDIFDSGRTMKKIVELLRPLTQAVKIATLYYKKNKNETALAPDFYLRETDKWIVFPHELMDLTPDEVRQKDPFIYRLVNGELPQVS